MSPELFKDDPEHKKLFDGLQVLATRINNGTSYLFEVERMQLLELIVRHNVQVLLYRNLYNKTIKTSYRLTKVEPTSQAVSSDDRANALMHESYQRLKEHEEILAKLVKQYMDKYVETRR